MTFGRLFKQLRKELGMTQIEFSKHLELSQGALSKIEHDKLEPNLETFVNARKLAEHTGHRITFDNFYHNGKL